MPYTEEHWVYPAYHTDNESFRLATTDLMVPPIYSTYGLVFQLNQACDKNNIIRWLKTGLEMTLGQCRQLIGTIEKNQFGDFSVVRKINNGIRLEVQWLDEEGPVSYSEMSERHFSSCAFGDIANLCVEGMWHHPKPY
jgi:hypothetical protein